MSEWASLPSFAICAFSRCSAANSKLIIPVSCVAVFAINGRIVGADLFDAAATFHKFMARLVESYAMDAIEGDAGQEAEITAQQVKQFIADMEAAVAERCPPVGEGEDVRLSGKDLAGGALIADGRVVHLSAFRLEPEPVGEQPQPRKRVRSLRRGISE